MEPFEQIDVGDKVRHPKFGLGTVMFRAGSGEDSKLTVKFGSDVGEKKLIVRYAKLKKIVERPTLAPEPTEGTAPEGENAPAAPAEALPADEDNDEAPAEGDESEPEQEG